MVVSIHQPSYFPWLGLLKKIFRSQLYVLMDEVQLSDRLFQHRNLFLDVNGQTRYLTIPINKKGFRGKKIKDITICDSSWQDDHKKFLLFNYKKSHFFDEVFQKIKIVFENKYKFLIDPLVASTKLSMDLFDIKTQVIMQSDLTYDRTRKKSDLILEIIKVTCADVYLSGLGAKEYLKLKDFQKEHIEILFNSFSHPQYHQINSDKFIPGLACLDVLFSIGIENSRKLFQGEDEG